MENTWTLMGEVFSKYIFKGFFWSTQILSSSQLEGKELSLSRGVICSTWRHAKYSDVLRAPHAISTSALIASSLAD
jgi:hypothetical protein